MRRLAVLLLVMTAAGLPMWSGATHAAPRGECQLNPQAGTVSNSFVPGQPLVYHASWEAIVDCPGTPVHGKTAVLTQDGALRVLGGGNAGGPARLTIVIDVDFGPATFTGQSKGRIVQGILPYMEQSNFFNGPRGAKADGTYILTLGPSLKFVPGVYGLKLPN